MHHVSGSRIHLKSKSEPKCLKFQKFALQIQVRSSSPHPAPPQPTPPRPSLDSAPAVSAGTKQQGEQGEKPEQNALTLKERHADREYGHGALGDVIS